MNFFIYNEGQLELNKAEILLVKEFANIYSLKFNQGETGDKDGRKRLRAYRLFAYIYLVHSWKSPYSDFSHNERHQAALEDTELDPKILEKEEVQALITKALELQDTRIVKLLKSAHRVVDELRHYFETIDLQERDPVTGKPIFAAKDLMANLASLSKTVESLQQLEFLVKKEKEQEKGLRGQAEPGLFDLEES